MRVSHRQSIESIKSLLYGTFATLTLVVSASQFHSSDTETMACR
jgi:hypothetical protein